MTLFNLVVYDLVNDALSYSDASSSGKVISNFLTGMCNEILVRNLRYCPYICLEAVINTTRNFCHVIRCPGRFRNGILLYII